MHQELPRSLKWLTRLVRVSAKLAIAVELLWAPIFWSQASFVRTMANAMSNLPDEWIVIDARAQWLGFLGSLPGIAIWTFGLWHLWRLFGHYEAGRYFAADTQKHLKRFAWSLLAATLLAPVEGAWMSFAFSLGVPPGDRHLQFVADGSLLVSCLTSAVMLAIAEVLSGASRVAERSRELEIASAAKTRFLAVASHDLRQPVVSISLLTELLREQALPAAAGAIVERIGVSVQALNELLKGLLDLSRFEAGAVQVHRTRIALRPLLARIVGDEAESARRKGIALRVRIAPYETHSDAVLLEQILRNLVGNAVRYTRSGAVLVGVRPRGADRVVVQVWDTGPGIPTQSQASVFDEFVQLDPHGEGRSGGLGLGLSLVSRAAHVLGAPIRLRSVVGQGSCFSIELPLAGFESAVLAPSPASQASLQGRRIWVVEDDPAVREALRLRLAGWGAVVRDFGAVALVREALADAAVVLPDLLLSDQRLPDGTGIEVAHLLRGVRDGLPVLIVTGDTSPADVALLHASGLPVLHKPFSSSGLLAAVNALGAEDASGSRP